MTYLLKVNTAHGPVVHIARSNRALDLLLERLYAAGPVSLFLTVQR